MRRDPTGRALAVHVLCDPVLSMGTATRLEAGCCSTLQSQIVQHPLGNPSIWWRDCPRSRQGWRGQHKSALGHSRHRGVLRWCLCPKTNEQSLFVVCGARSFSVLCCMGRSRSGCKHALLERSKHTVLVDRNRLAVGGRAHAGREGAAVSEHLPALALLSSVTCSQARNHWLLVWDRRGRISAKIGAQKPSFSRNIRSGSCLEVDVVAAGWSPARCSELPGRERDGEETRRARPCPGPHWRIAVWGARLQGCLEHQEANALHVKKAPPEQWCGFIASSRQECFSQQQTNVELHRASILATASSEFSITQPAAVRASQNQPTSNQQPVAPWLAFPALLPNKSNPRHDSV